MKRVLIFSYYWPPAGGVAVQRFLKFSKYLPQFDWKPIVVTPRNGSYPYTDESLLKEVSPEVEVHYTNTFEPFEVYNLLRGKKGKSVPLAVGVGEQQGKSAFQKLSEFIRANFFIPDARKGWMPYAVKEAEKLIQAEKIDAIITTGPPHSSHLIGLKLKEKYGIPWIADFRDPWTNIFYNDFLPRTSRSKQKDKEYETAVLQTADISVVISPGMLEEFKPKAKRIELLYNGFDEDDFKVSADVQEGFFTMRYVGSFLTIVNPPALWNAIKELIDTNQAFAQYFRLEVIGRIDDSIRSIIVEKGLTNWITEGGFVDHNQAIRLMKGGDLLLLSLANTPGNKSIMTGKIFEYIATNRPILGFAPPDGDASKLLLSLGRETLIDHADKDGAKAFIETYFAKWMEQKKGFEYPDSNYLSCSRRVQTKTLSELLLSISKNQETT